MGSCWGTRRADARLFLTTAILASAVLALGAGPARAAGTPPATASGSPAAGHPYRHGVVPIRGSGTSTQAPLVSSANNLQYGGGVSGVGVTTGPPRVYLVFWGSQWGTASTNAQGYTTLSGDTRGMAPYYQAFVKGLGTSSELWSGVMTQYCEGVASGSQSCPATAAHVGYPTGGALAGVWADTSAAAPGSASGHQIGVEAVNAAAHFANTTAAANRNVQYVIVSPSGTTPDGFNTASGNFCAWHDYTGDSTLTGGAVSSAYGLLAFTNMPYVTDAGSGCGMNFVNAGSAGTLDGVSIVGGHEYAETITDQYPAGGWTDTSGNENGDKCAWISSGQGASQNITLTTGTFAVQSTWSNDTANCQVSHALPGNDFSIAASPAGVSVAPGAAATTTVSTAVTGGSAQSVAFSASGLPAGASASFSPTSVTAGGSSTLTLQTSTSTPVGTYSVTVTGAGASVSHATTVSLTVATAGGGGGVVVNGGFELGSFSGWTTSGASESLVSASHSGAYADRGGSTTATNGDSVVAQTIQVPAAGGTLSFWYAVTCPDTVTYDWATAQITNAAGTVLATPLAKTCTNTSTWTRVTYNLASLAGQAVVLKLISHDDNYAADPTYTRYDDVTVTPPVNDFSIAASPAGVSVAPGAAATTTVSTAVTSGSAQSVAFSAAGLPAGASASFSPTSVTAGGSSTLTLQTSTSTPAGTYSVTVTGAGASVSHATTVSLTVATAGGGGVVVNGGFELGSFSGWTTSGASESLVSASHSGAWADRGGSTSPTNGDSVVAQTIQVPAAGGTLSFWYAVTCPDTVTYDWATAQITNPAGTVLATPLAKTCTNTSTWTRVTYNLASLAGQTVVLKLISHDDNYAADPTYTRYDDVTVG